MIGLVALVLLISASIYIVVALEGARDELAAELDAARIGGAQTVRSAFEDLPRSDHPARDLRQLIATFDGNRHVRATVLDRFNRVRINSATALPHHLAPGWFATMLTPQLEPTLMAVPEDDGGLLRLQPEPASDVAALWQASLNAAILFAIAAVVGLSLIYWMIGRALAPLQDLACGLELVGAAGYHGHVREQGPREVVTLQRGFNAMAERLADIDARNGALEAQLLTIQDEERAEIARDLHDEIGPHLFAVALDAEMISRNLADGQTRVIAEQVRSIQNAVSYMQREVRELIARLRPTRATELGLEAALSDLVAFWHARQPDVAFITELSGADGFVPDVLRDVIYRVVQESVANALRHAQTTLLTIGIMQTTSGISVSVENRGTPKGSAQDLSGLGLASMRERVHAARGVLRIHRADEGWTVDVRFGLISEVSPR